MIGGNLCHEEIICVGRLGHDPGRAGLFANHGGGRVVAVLAPNWPTAVRAAEGLVRSGQPALGSTPCSRLTPVLPTPQPATRTEDPR